MRLSLLADLNAERAARRLAVLVTDIATGDQRLIKVAEVGSDPLAPLFAEALAAGESSLVAVGGRPRLFFNIVMPPPRLLVTGAVHISQALVPMARLLGYDVVIIDPRAAFATADRFPNAELVAEWPDTALARLGLDRRTAVMALTHDPKIDDPCLMAALASGVFYVGALGSRRTHAKRVERLKAAGFGDGDIARVHAPIGLDLGAQSPAEIALAILAEVTATLRRAGRRPERRPGADVAEPAS
ncbi:XdhC family protein [Blastochloris viridis]|uniref:Aerobic carbon monoxide dehydrogenase molybdenum cofactor insertion protein CoxF n=1 Tax=Blastochloris viridis TaxID=1079 RepID=A0A0H5BG39_BLAVI|nr:XdhC family protein [Blastochloris viridis]ALK10003.1 putative xanthine dehydrogenase subunit A [Blastochloris viridis]BAS00080.1 aerobic carbon monoxide dehydrogenase molybdenum cofactor insertion protein CoxF [Blastochloris viridis]CUU42667.1 xanthine dehydrogenase accessory protein XdhC [Blastochloris viridis]